MISEIFLQILKVSLFTSVLIGLLLVLVPLLQKRYRAKWRYLLWLAIAARLLVPVDIGLPALYQAPVSVTLSEPAFVPDETLIVPVEPAIDAPAVSNESETTLSEPVDPLPSVENSAQPAALPRLSVSPMTVLGMLWFFGAAVFVLVQICAYRRFMRRLRLSQPTPATNEIKEILWRSGIEMGVCKLPAVLITPVVEAPVLVGIRNPLVLLPHTAYESETLSFIFRHELVHYRRKDMLYKLIMVAANACHWFNPLVYAMVVQASKDIECACDDDVARELDTDARARYGGAILSALPRKRRLEPVFSTHFGSGKKNIKSRLNNLFDNTAKRRGIAALCAAVAVTLVLSSAVTLNFAAEQSDNVSVMRLGRFPLNAGDVIKNNLSWNGEQTIILLRTPRDYTNEEIIASLQGLPGIPVQSKTADTIFTPGDQISFTTAGGSPLIDEQDVSATGEFSFYIVQYGFESFIPMGGSITCVQPNGTITMIWTSNNEPALPALSKTTYPVTIYTEPIGGVEDPSDMNADPDNRWLDKEELGATSWQQQVNAEIKYLAELYADHPKGFVITESVPKSEVTDITRINDLYHNSPVFRDMSTIRNGVFQVQNERNFAHFTPFWDALTEETVHRTAVMAEDTADLFLDIDYQLTEGKMAVWLISPSGKMVYQGDFNTGNQTALPVTGEKGLWSVVRVYQGGESQRVAGQNIKITLRMATAITPPAPDVPPLAGATFSLASNPGQLNIAASGSFSARKGQRLTIQPTSTIQGGTVDFMLFTPTGGQHRFGFGGSNGPAVIDLSESGTYAYNCSGIFQSGGIRFDGYVQNVVDGVVESPPNTAPDATGNTFLSNAWILNDFGHGANVLLEFPAWYTEEQWDVDFVLGSALSGYEAVPLEYAHLDSLRRTMVGVGNDMDYELRVTLGNGKTIAVDLRDVVKQARTANNYLPDYYNG